MWTPTSTILDAAKAHPEIDVKQRPDLSASDLRSSIFHKFAHSEYLGRLFEDIIPNSIGSNDPNFLALVRNFPARKLIVFFEEDNHVFEFKSFSDFVVIIDECPFFTSYLTDADLSFIVCCTEEATLVVAGEAKNWL